MWAVQYHRYGNPEVMRLEQTEAPTLRTGEVLLETISSGVSGIDALYRSGQLRLHGVGFPKQPGFDALGIIRESRIPGIEPGRWAWTVLGIEPFKTRGTAVQFLSLDAGRLGLFPPGFAPDVDAGALPLGALTAWRALTHSARPQPGDRLLIVGAGGPVGTSLIQLARYLGHEIDAVAGQAALTLCGSLGAEHALRHSTEQATELQSTQRYDKVFVAAGRAEDWLGAAKPGGQVIVIRGDVWLSAIPQALKMRRRLTPIAAGHDATALTRLAELHAADHLRPVVGRTYSLQDLPTAHAELSVGGTVGGRLVVH